LLNKTIQRTRQRRAPLMVAVRCEGNKVPEYTCGNCGIELSEDFCRPKPDRRPCPSCGDFRRNAYVKIEEKCVAQDGLGIKARHPDQRKPFYESYGGPDRSRSLGKLVHKERTIDRENDDYREHVHDYETGEVLHHCEEPLSEHRGHGDAKKKR